MKLLFPGWMVCYYIALEDIPILINHTAPGITKGNDSGEKEKYHWCALKVMSESLVDAYRCDCTVTYRGIPLAGQRVISVYSILTAEWCAPANSASQWWALLKIHHKANIPWILLYKGSANSPCQSQSLVRFPEVTFPSSTEKFQQEGHSPLVCQWIYSSAQPLLAKRFPAAQSCPVPLWALQKVQVSSSPNLSRTELTTDCQEVPQPSSHPFSLHHTLRYETCCKQKVKHREMQSVGSPCSPKHKFNCQGQNSLRGFVPSSAQGEVNAQMNFFQAGRAQCPSLCSVGAPRLPLLPLFPPLNAEPGMIQGHSGTQTNKEVHIDIWEKNSHKWPPSF